MKTSFPVVVLNEKNQNDDVYIVNNIDEAFMVIKAVFRKEKSEDIGKKLQSAKCKKTTGNSFKK